jgi:hypothetical protein
MQKWEYLRVWMSGGETVNAIYPDVHGNYYLVGKTRAIDDVFTRLGAEGWELVAIHGALCIFKRPVPNR